MKDFEKQAKEFETYLKQLGWERVVHCATCEYHRDRVNLCDVWHTHTNPAGYCHRAKAVKKG